MDVYGNKKQIIGKIFFVLSIFMLIYLITSPITHIFTHIDEYFTVTYMNFPVFDIITATSNDVHPPLYYLIAKIIMESLRFFGIHFDTLFILKLVSIIPYALILVISFTKIKKDYGWLTAGLFPFTVVVMSNFFFYYLTARMYSWGVLFLLLSFLSFKDLITKFDTDSLILFTIFSVCCFYIQYFIGISVIVLYVMLLVYILLFEEKDKLKYWLLSVIGAIIIFVPWVPSLITQMTTVKGDFWIPEVTFDVILSSFAFFVNSDLIFDFLAVLILIVFIIIYYLESADFDDKTSFFIVTGFAVYIGTIMLSVFISKAYKPILTMRYLVPATAVLWLTISILINKINNKKLLLISSVLIVILLISGINCLISQNNDLYNDGMAQQNLIEKIAQDNNSVVIVTTPNLFLQFSDKWDIYSISSWLNGISMDSAHQVYDFKELDRGDVVNFVNNNSEKNIYLASWGDAGLSGEIFTVPNLHYDGWDIYNVSSEPIKVIGTVIYDNGTIDNHNDIWAYVKNPTVTRGTEYTSITDVNGFGYVELDMMDNIKMEFDMKQYGGKDNWGIVFYNSSGSSDGFSLSNSNAQVDTWYHVEITIINGTISETLNGTNAQTRTLENPNQFALSINNDIKEIQFKNFKAYPL